MQVVVEIPEILANEMKAREPDLSRAVLESVLIESYRHGDLTRGQIAQILGMSFHEAEQWFAAKGVVRNYDVEDLEEDRRTLAKLFPR